MKITHIEYDNNVIFYFIIWIVNTNSLQPFVNFVKSLTQNAQKVNKISTTLLKKYQFQQDAYVFYISMLVFVHFYRIIVITFIKLLNIKV